MRQQYLRGGITMKALAKQYGVSSGAISLAIRGKTWKHRRNQK
jgi:transposase-like protein